MALGREQEIIKQYVDTGQARLVFRNMQFLGDESKQAGAAAECAAEQNKFAPYYDYLYERQGAENSGVFSKENLKQYGQAIGLDAASFSSCVDSGRYLSRVEAETQAGKSLGVTSTPTLFIEGEKLRGVPAMTDIAAAVDRARAAKNK